MATINLLPWREQLKEEQKKRFSIILISCIAIGCLIVVFWHWLLTHEINQQQSRNKLLLSHINMLDTRIIEIRKIKAKRNQMLERVEIIKGLQGNRPISVKVFDELARIVPDGIYFKSLQLMNNKLILIGVAEDNSQISKLMRNFDRSLWFKNPNLMAVKKISRFNQSNNEFNLLIEQTSPQKNSQLNGKKI